MKLSYSMALFCPPVLSNLETSNSRTTGDTPNPRLNSASRNSPVSILPLRSLSNLSKIDYDNKMYIQIIRRYINKTFWKQDFGDLTYPPVLKTVIQSGEFLWPCFPTFSHPEKKDKHINRTSNLKTLETNWRGFRHKTNTNMLIFALK